MAKRSSSGQSAHDREVLKVVRQLKRDGWDVSADLPAFPKPAPIGAEGRIPDVEAHKRGHRKLVEVETPESLETDRDQQETFRRSVGAETQRQLRYRRDGGLGHPTRSR